MAVPLTHGQKAMTGSAVQLSSSSAPVDTVVLKALSGNAADLYFGLTGVTSSTGYPLSPGEEFTIAPGNGPLKRVPLLSQLYAVGTSGDDLAWIATPR